MTGLSFAAPRIGTAMSAIFVGTIPLYSMVIGRLWGTETITRQGAVGLVIGFSGMVVLWDVLKKPMVLTRRHQLIKIGRAHV